MVIMLLTLTKSGNANVLHNDCQCKLCLASDKFSLDITNLYFVSKESPDIDLL